ncbi:aldo/keto reductase [Candidatus Lucifugimonas marina]|uniref:Aldo/keto reductase n=2 Tax=Candidatus Lucifugimonas marina TaxID=3038979 RepID=A0AAJ5ZG21_9CHLR|nr:aldo/keto reductase [SAR202 cluster bacterium JH702]MDG0868874.1 aldo/keto reductase [SAR202 cluster bacterium JH639]WFG35502.1 aldo/keto reductase [SAR202 cluster bacterium JH545]WFG39449.1 aldo/keto reductase [SAR202 cluster bacterium JH1073]
MAMETKRLGKIELEVGRLGVGLSEVGFNLEMTDVDQARDVINLALDSGVNFLDTAACYGISEELLGMVASERRDEFVLATKAGHYLPRGEGEDWTYDLIISSIDRSLERMKTDYVDLVQLHSCTVEVLERGDVIRALQDAKAAGKTRFVGYSGDNENAKWAVTSGLFDTLQTSFNLVDQSARTNLFADVETKDMGLIIKRPIGNAVWGADADPVPYKHIPEYAAEYFRRAGVMSKEGPLADNPNDRIRLALGFTFAHPEVDVTIVGTQRPHHMRSNLEMVAQPLGVSEATVQDLHARWDKLSAGWEQRG